MSDASTSATVQSKDQRSDKEHSTGAMLTVYACAAIGGGIAAIADVVQKEQASAVVKITSVSARHLDLAVPPLYVLGVIVVLGVLLCFVFQPVNRKAGFAVGAGVIASIMTVTPYQTPESGAPTEQEDQTYLLPKAPVLLASSNPKNLLLAAYLSDVASVLLTNDLDRPVEVRVSFYDRNSRRAYEQAQSIAPGKTGIFRFTAEANDDLIEGEYYIAVDDKRSGFFTISGPAPAQSATQTLTAALPALDTASNEPSTGGVFYQLQKTLTTPKKW